MLSIKLVNVTGVQQRIQDKVSLNKVENALDKGAMLVERDAKRQVRVDTGRLKNSIDVIKTEPLTRSIGTSVRYAAAQEYGRPDLKNYGFTPYLRPALRKNKGNINKLISEALER